MENRGYVLAEVPGFGRVFDCGNCGNVHVTVGAVSVTLAPAAYMQLVTLLNTSASNFEVWMQSKPTTRDAGGPFHGEC